MSWPCGAVANLLGCQMNTTHHVTKVVREHLEPIKKKLR